ncbi:hypothetical protein [Candidatus Spongiihabitans sp.]|uniref:hypothetical protein n=1 Tax=Candidatus Spongiihabitans sp. TaxID=3101308 RepID=UPI003C7C890B
MTPQIYLKQLDQHYQAGIATEHTYRAALQALLESALPGVAVTNEPPHPRWQTNRQHQP